ncbi:OmpA family protein [Fibrella sp. HMF5335]|uniref:OmpA family protein n=1 Tax=Fibrella rubiginis TaxID=2817060 RepID=A0A939GEV9_9BACT|nr:OmpA family protein [Fibrella rubiginis]MBO0936508.1 OmpA family protein [Fibrella rubiginis]
MATLLLDHLRSVFTGPAINDLARITGEDIAHTQKAIDGLLPAITAGVINQIATSEGATKLNSLLTTTSFSTDPSVNQLVGQDEHRQKAAASGNRLLQQLFTDRVERLPEVIASHSGINTSSASTITGLVMSVLMGFLHRELTTQNLTGSQLASMLRGDSESVRSAIPAALLPLLGWFIGGDTTRLATPLRTETVSQPIRNDQAAGTPWWRWLLYLLPMLLLFLLLRNCGKGDNKATTTTDTTTTAPVNNGAGAAVTADTVASDLDGNGPDSVSLNKPEVRVGVDLPGGRQLNVAENSFNYSLARFLAAKNGKTPKVFTFDNLTFDTNSARITDKARTNVDDLIQIMQAYPTLAIRIEGNTDSTGDDAINDPLSGERAEAVKEALIKGGISADRIATRERGDSKPVASNATPDGREKNRRIDVIVTKM